MEDLAYENEVIDSVLKFNHVLRLRGAFPPPPLFQFEFLKVKEKKFYGQTVFGRWRYPT